MLWTWVKVCSYIFIYTNNLLLVNWARVDTSIKLECALDLKSYQVDQRWLTFAPNIRAPYEGCWLLLVLQNDGREEVGYGPIRKLWQ